MSFGAGGRLLSSAGDDTGQVRREGLGPRVGRLPAADFAYVTNTDLCRPWWPAASRPTPPAERELVRDDDAPKEPVLMAIGFGSAGREH
ncbi:hypothetical protein ABZ922_43325 [Streptomyces shenzhenensis]|uniref:hypothetical protein n=1 Tax=Streptomyces shenzhenensis TaxID=943815 RepID=UPI0033E14D4E